MLSQLEHLKPSLEQTNDPNLLDPSSQDLKDPEYTLIMSSHHYVLCFQNEHRDTIQALEIRKKYRLSSLDLKQDKTWTLYIDAHYSTHFFKKGFDLFMGHTFHIERPSYYSITHTHVGDCEGGIGTICNRFSLFKRKYDLIMNGQGQIGRALASFWKPTCFMVYNQSHLKMADIHIDQSIDRHQLSISLCPTLGYEERVLIITLALCIDVDYYTKSSG